MTNFQKFQEAIDKCEQGDTQSELFLRLRLEHMSKEMPVALLLILSKEIQKYRDEEIRSC